MARAGFLDEGSNVQYPLIADQAGAPPTFAIADFGSVMLIGSGYVEAEHSVFLQEIRRTGSTFEFDFRSDAPGLDGLALVFRRSIDDDRFLSEYTDAESTSGGESSTCPFDPLWTGFMVSGDMRRLATVLADGNSILGPFNLEPSRTQNLDKGYVRSIGVANAERTRATTADDCRDYCWGFPLQDHYIVCDCLSGDVRFAEGFNASVRLESLDNQLVLSAEVGSGLGEPCDEVELFDSETPPTGSNLLSGGPGCGDVIRSINGIGKSFLNVSGGTGVTITSVPDQHRLIVAVDLHTMAICQDLPDDMSADPLDSSSYSCECGEI